MRLTNSDFPAYKPQAPWWGADLQTLRNKIWPPPIKLESYRRRLLVLTLPDGSGDALIATLWYPEASSQPPSAAGPLTILIHGLGGDANSVYIRATASHLLENGHPVLTVDLRGAGRSGPYCCLQNHPGRTEDICGLMEGLPDKIEPALLDRGVMLVGFSLGGNILLKFLGKEAVHFSVRGAAIVSGPLDLAAAARRLNDPRNLGYQWYLLRRMKNQALRPKADLTAKEQAVIQSVRSVWEFDDRFTAPHTGFEGAEAYYAEHAAKPYLDQIRLPTLLIFALDDPIVAGQTYLDFSWEEHPALIPLIVETGGHNGFHGQGSAAPWSSHCLIRFLEYLERRDIESSS